MTARLIRVRGVSLSCSPRCVPGRWATTVNAAARAGSRPRDRRAAGVGQDALPQVLCRNATARRGTVKVMPPRTCSPGPATSRPASSRFGRLPAERSRPIRTSSTSSGAACPTPRCPPGPTLSDQEVSDLAYYIKTFSPDFAVAENVPEAHGTSERAGRHERVHRAREEALRGERLPQVPRHARPGRRTFGFNPG